MKLTVRLTRSAALPVLLWMLLLPMSGCGGGGDTAPLAAPDVELEIPEDSEEFIQQVNAQHMVELSTLPTAGTLNVPKEYPTIQEAIDAAQPGDIIEIEAGRYRENLVIDDKEITLTSIDGPIDTILDAGGVGSAIRILHTGFDPVTIRGLTIANGSAEQGGGIYSDASKTILENNIFQGNLAAQGGAVYMTYWNPGWGSPRTARWNVFVENHATDSGGAVYIQGVQLLAEYNGFYQNTAGVRGGAMFFLQPQESTDDEEYYYVPLPDTRIHHNRFLQNQAGLRSGEGKGGAIATSIAALRIYDNSFSENHAGEGGALHIEDSLSTYYLVDIRTNYIRNNSADQDGGGIVLDNPWMSLSRNVVIQNSAGGNGGGLFIKHSDGSISNCTVADNVGGGLRRMIGTTDITLKNNLLWGNQLNGQSQQMAGNFGASTGHIANYVQGAAFGSEDPLFANPARGNYQLRRFSPCIDAAVASGQATDFFGNPMHDDAGVVNAGGPAGAGAINFADIGAYERQVDSTLP